MASLQPAPAAFNGESAVVDACQLLCLALRECWLQMHVIEAKRLKEPGARNRMLTSAGIDHIECWLSNHLGRAQKHPYTA